MLAACVYWCITEHLVVLLAAANAGKLLSYWNMPFLSYSASDPDLADKAMYSTLVRMMSPFNRMAEAVVQILQYYQVRAPTGHCYPPTVMASFADSTALSLSPLSQLSFTHLCFCNFSVMFLSYSLM